MLTLKQKQTFDFIGNFINKFNHSPTAAEIAKGIGIKSRGVVHRYLKALESQGFLELAPKRHRNIRLKEKRVHTMNLPLVGTIAAGQPIEAIEQDEAIDVASIFLGADRYALRVKGDSMIDEGIHDGDIVVCQKSDEAKDGQIVVALIDQQEATLKRLQRNADLTISLIPSNKELNPMVFSANRVQIQGIFLGLLRFQA